MDIVDRKLDQNIERAHMEISSLIAEKGELSTEITKLAGLPAVEIRDREYLEIKTKGMISRCERILDRLEESFDAIPDECDERTDAEKKSGFSLYAVDVYAKIINAVAVQVRELRELNKMVMGIDVINAEQVMKRNEEEVSKQDKTVKMSSSDLLKLIKEAGASSEIKAVDAEFKEVNDIPKEPDNEPVQ